jgi:hypothetical protein
MRIAVGIYNSESLREHYRDFNEDWYVSLYFFLIDPVFGQRLYMQSFSYFDAV